MAKVTLWSNGASYNRLAHKPSNLDRYSPHNVSLRDIWAAKPGRDEAYAKRQRVEIERKAGAVRDKSRKAIVQSGGYVTSGWAKQTKGGVSHVSRKVANQALRKLVIG